MIPSMKGFTYLLDLFVNLFTLFPRSDGPTFSEGFCSTLVDFPH